MESLKEWKRTLPASKLRYPVFWTERFKYWLWTVIRPFHNFFRDAALYVGIIRHAGRQDYLLGHVASHQSIKALVEYLIGEGWRLHHVALEDEGELVSLRYLTDFQYQYHLRIFEDREVRAHYEYTPECYPMSHMRADDVFEHRPQELLKLLGNRITPIHIAK